MYLSCYLGDIPCSCRSYSQTRKGSTVNQDSNMLSFSPEPRHSRQSPCASGTYTASEWQWLNIVTTASMWFLYVATMLHTLGSTLRACFGHIQAASAENVLGVSWAGFCRSRISFVRVFIVGGAYYSAASAQSPLSDDGIMSLAMQPRKSMRTIKVHGWSKHEYLPRRRTCDWEIFVAFLQQVQLIGIAAKESMKACKVCVLGIY